MSKEKKSGRQFSKHAVEVFVDEHGRKTELHSLDPLTIWSEHSIEKHKQKAIAVLEAEGINVEWYFQDSPHGSTLRDYVLNYLEHAPDSNLGLAARIVELCCHAQTYKAMSAGEQLAGTIGRLSHLVTLSRVYEIADRPRQDGYKKSAEVRNAKAKPRHDRIIRLAEDLLASGRERREIAGIIASRVPLSVKHIRSILRKNGI